MWTYKTPYTADEKTRPYIEKRGRLALSRALNIGRVVGFIASGATSAYGQISWGELVSKVVKLSIELSKKPDVRKSGALRAAQETLMRFQKDGQLQGNPTHILGLASNLAELAGKKQIFREEAAKLFAGTRQQDSTSLLDTLGFEQRANPLRCLVSELRLSRFLTLNYDVEIEEEFRRLYRTSGTTRTDVIPTSPSNSSEELLLEREEPESAFDVLCDGKAKFHRALNLPRRVEYSDGTSRSVLSVSMSSENISDLVNFALHPRQFVGQVVHLHGRYDKPNDMVMTDEDYRLKYMKTDESALCFEEALSALHAGNDILFVGSGMREADILQPLRQFISQDKSPDFAQRHVFALLENRVTLDEEWLENVFDQSVDALTKSFARHHLLHAELEAPEDKGASRNDYNSDEQEALRLRNEFGVFALFHGGEELRTIRIALSLIRRLIPKQRKEGRKRVTVGFPKTPKEAKALRAAIVAVSQQLQSQTFDLSKLVSRDETKKIASLLNDLEKALMPDSLFAAGSSGVAAFVGIEEVLKQHSVDNKSLGAVETEVRSRALALAITDLETRRGEWWRDWRARPKERNAKFRASYLKNDNQRLVPTHARHRPVYQTLVHEEGKTAFESFQVLRKLREFAQQEVEQTQSVAVVLERRKKQSPETTLSGGHLKRINSNDLNYFKDEAAGHQRNFEKVPPRRIIRCCMPRGFGKGSLLHILQQPDPSGQALVLDDLFQQWESGSGNDRPIRYHGAFCLHLSFSMEFASVISALKEFVEDALIGILTDYPGSFLEAAEKRLSAAEPVYRDTFLDFLHRDIGRAGDAGGPIKAELQKLKSATEEQSQISKSNLRHLLNDGFWKNKELARGRGRMHRLEELRVRLSAYTDVVDVMNDYNLRLFFAISGLDKLCDEQGNAYNPMFRALFRLLTGCGAKYASESDVTLPIDLLLVSGTRGAPIRYLSPEVKEKKVKRAVLEPGKGAPLDFIAPLQTTTQIGRKRFMRDWPVVPPISMSERYWIDAKDKWSFRRLLKEDEDNGNPDSASLRRSLNTGVALSSWCAGAIGQFQRGTGSAVRDEAKKKQKVREIIRTLDGAAARGGIAQILRELMEIHKVELRAWGGLLVQDKIRHQTQKPPLPLPATWPDKSSFADCTRAAQPPEAESNEGNKLVELAYVILAYLSLFPMPVEPRVLYGCDEVHDLLKQICKPDTELASTDSSDQNESDSSRRSKAAERETARKRRLRVLSQLLDYLNQSNLIIAVRGKSGPQTTIITDSLELGGPSLSADDVHTRFTVQHQLRDFGARLMDLSVPDQGERNFFQTSIYCDQPRDLPSPNEDHYRLVRDILERQIVQSRNTVWCITQLMRLTDTKQDYHKRSFENLTRNDKYLTKVGLERRLFELSESNIHNSSLKYSRHFETIHAVPQRLRAVYGLLRSGFSIGTISRLAGLDEKFPDQPYERFRGWLRGVTNAAIAWDVLVDHYFKPETSDVSKTSFNKAVKSATENEKGVQTISRIYGEIPTEGFARPLYRDEIGWLLNERGLVALVTGNVFDAIPLFQRALDEMHHDDIEGYYDPSLHAAVRRVRLNMCIALIERGHLDRAASGLSELQLPNGFSDHTGSQISWLAKGYLGLVQHLTGNHAGARIIYKEALERSRERGMMRSVAIFSKHLADLERRNANFIEARKQIQNAIDAALQCAQRDIYQLTRVSKASLELSEKGAQAESVGDVISEAIEFSHSMGVPRIEVEALRLQANSLVIQGDRMQSGKFASRAAAIANRNGLRLQKLAALVTYGSAMRERGHENQGLRILEETKREAERRGYQSLARDIYM